MNAAPVLEQPYTVAATFRSIAAAATTREVAKKDYEAVMIVAIAIVIAFTFTVCVIGTILMMLALRGSGVMANLQTHIPAIG